MELIERIVCLLFGGIVGFILGYIVAKINDIKQEVDEVLDIEHHRGERGITRLRTIVMDTVLLAVVLIVAYAAWASNQATNAIEDDLERDKRSLCKSGEEDREIDRKLVEAIFNLAMTQLDDAAKRDLGPEQIQRFNGYVDDLNSFRSAAYREIRPSELCLPYVDDAGVKPPPPPAPHYQDWK